MGRSANVLNVRRSLALRPRGPVLPCPETFPCVPTSSRSLPLSAFLGLQLHRPQVPGAAVPPEVVQAQGPVLAAAARGTAAEGAEAARTAGAAATEVAVTAAATQLGATEAMPATPVTELLRAATPSCPISPQVWAVVTRRRERGTLPEARSCLGLEQEAQPLPGA